jgi:hypothetical protein
MRGCARVIDCADFFRSRLPRYGYRQQTDLPKKKKRNIQLIIIGEKK